MLKRVVIGGAAIVALLSLPVVTAQRADAGKQVEWLYYGGDQGGTKYSTLTDVNPDNVQRLQIAWQWKHFDVPLEQYGTTPGQFEAVPLMSATSVRTPGKTLRDICPSMGVTLTHCGIRGTITSWRASCLSTWFAGLFCRLLCLSSRRWRSSGCC